MSAKQARTFTLACITLLASLSACSPKPAEPQAGTLDLVKHWVHFSSYNNVAQAAADFAAELPPEQMHRPMHQLLARVDVHLRV
jgi:hypothetical protein